MPDRLRQRVTIKISSRDTGGEYTVFESWTEPLSGPPLHLHHEQDECWYILEGHYRFQVDGKDLYASAGDTVLAPPGHPAYVSVYWDHAGPSADNRDPGRARSVL
jgi:mannose-6-phosphate isomerase-like protein (cupin superfamily)